MNVQSNGAADDISAPAVTEMLERIKRHQDAGRFDDAGKLLDELLIQHHDNAKLIHYKGYNLIKSGNPEEGVKLIESALAIAPEDPLQLTDYGAILAQTGKLEEATEKFRTAVEVAPNYSVARANLGAALVLDKKYAEAIVNLEKAVELDTGFLDAYSNLAIAYMQTENFGKAVDTLFKALSVDPQSVATHVHLASALYRRERYEAAEHHARRALDLAPNTAEARLHLGNALASSGKIDEAAQELLKIAGHPPVGLVALSRLVHLRKTKPDAPELKLIETYLPLAENLSEEQRATLLYAAGKAYDDLARYDLAWQNFQAANDINKVLYPFDDKQLFERSERLLAFASPALLRRCADGGVRTVAPIFICGMPRSGTTLMDQMFSRHSKVQAGGELRASNVALHQNTRIRDALEEKIEDIEITGDDFSRLGEDYVAAVRQEGIRSEFVSDKMPSNYRYIGMLSLALPRARFLVMRRHPLDCLLSNYFQHFGRNQPFSSDIKHLAAVYQEFDTVAKEWAARLPDAVRQVSYEDVTRDAEGQMRSILEFIGLEWEPEILDHKASFRQVNTASIAQVREPIYSRAVERWRHYGPNLAPLAAELRDYLTAEELAACGLD